jgi:3-vinyl bacteriochlorophyllide hydratase
MEQPQLNRSARAPLYTRAERARRDASVWTPVQGVLAAVQFLVFLISCVLVWRFLATGEGAAAATASVVAKTLALYAIMITGALWERDVFGQYLFARSFFWEDVVSMLVIALHTAYLVTWLFDLLPLKEQFLLALCAYGSYVVNASQFLFKFRRARQQAVVSDPSLVEVRA